MNYTQEESHIIVYCEEKIDCRILDKIKGTNSSFYLEKFISYGDPYNFEN